MQFSVLRSFIPAKAGTLRWIAACAGVSETDATPKFRSLKSSLPFPSIGDEGRAIDRLNPTGRFQSN
jgi:hypothetical protein